MFRCGLALLTLVLTVGCASRSQTPLSDGTLSEYLGQARELGVRAQPAPATESMAGSVEAQDPTLSAALLALAVAPGPALHRRVADRFRELKILDKAYDHYASARRLDPADAEAYEGLARIWRDWGFPHLGLTDASRAVFYAPASASAHNTLGTILTALGRAAEARQSYERAMALDPDAAYVFNNLCYLSFLEGQISRAVAECAKALRLDPSLMAARNNLALAYAADSRNDLARREFMAVGNTAAGLYNMGIVHMAGKQYGRALEAFEAARRQRPSWAAARRRASRARALAALSPGRGAAAISDP